MDGPALDTKPAFVGWPIFGGVGPNNMTVLNLQNELAADATIGTSRGNELTIPRSLLLEAHGSGTLYFFGFAGRL